MNSIQFYQDTESMLMVTRNSVINHIEYIETERNNVM